MKPHPARELRIRAKQAEFADCNPFPPAPRFCRAVANDAGQFFLSIAEAATACGRCPSAIRMSIQRHTRCAGRRWYYASDDMACYI